MSDKSDQLKYAKLLQARERTGKKSHGRYVHGHITAKKQLPKVEAQSANTAIALHRVSGRDKTAFAALNEKSKKLRTQMQQLRKAISQPGRYFWEDGNVVYRPPNSRGGGGGIAT